MAAGGVVATHLLTFFVAAPDGHHRADVLDRTGHFSFTFVAAALLGLVVAGVVRFLPLRRPVVQLLAVQSAGWLLLEATERLSHPGADWELGIIGLGLVVQAAVAVAGGLLLRAVQVVLDLVARRRRPVFEVAKAALRPVAVRTFTRPAVLAGAAGLRGPPYRS